MNTSSLILKNFIPVLLAFFLLCACHRQKISYPLPKDISKDNRRIMTAYFNRGMELYKIHCADCHGIFSKVRDQSPDFTRQQLDTYRAKAHLQTSELHSFTERISYNDLEAILHFLIYKKVKQ